jgi:hypothetical protein
VIVVSHTFNLIKELHSVGRDGEQVTDVAVASEDLLISCCLVWPAGLTALMWSVNELRSSSLMVCVALVPAVPLTVTLPLLVCRLYVRNPSPKPTYRGALAERRRE